jgi:peptide/nickel transport system substrate-binding protein
MGIKVATIQGGNPETIDYSWCYDTASAEIIQNVQDTLIAFNGEQILQYIGRVAKNWTGPGGGLGGYFAPIPLNGGLGIDSGLPIAGLQFANPLNQTGPNAKWFYRYVFEIRTPIKFAPPYNYTLNGTDIEYSFERTLIQDRTGGPTWMLAEPLLDNAAGTDKGVGGIANLTNAIEVAELGALIRDSVQSNATHVWFNIMFPSNYVNMFMQILCQTWSSIASKQWMVNQVIPTRPDWDGDWSNVSAWVDSHNPGTSPLDTPTPMMYGSGPFQLLALDQANSFWELTRHVAYWSGWPANYPILQGASPGGYVNDVYMTWAFDWATAKTMYLAGDIDFVAVPQRSFAPELYTSATPPYEPPNYPVNGTRCIQPLPTLIVDGYMMTLHVDPTTIYGPIGPNGIYNETLIPADFFSNVNVRKAFAYAFDYDNYTQTAYMGEGQHALTAIIPNLPYWNSSIPGYTFNLALANASFNAVPGLAQNGFTIQAVYNSGNIARKTGALLLKEKIESLNPKFHVNAQNVIWSTVLSQIPFQRVPLYRIGWQGDFADAHNFVVPFYASYGTFAAGGGYSNATMDSLIAQGVNTPDGNARAEVYSKIQQLAIDDCPGFTVVWAFGRHFERDWVQGYYFNQLYSGYNYYNLWKWYYVPNSLKSVSQPPAGYNEPADVNYDGKANIVDVSTVAKSFGATYGPPIHARWIFRADMNLDRKIDIRDVSYVAKQFGKESPAWTPSGAMFPTIVASVTPYISPNDNLTYTATVTGNLSNVNYQWRLDNVIVGTNAMTYTKNFTALGDFQIFVNVTNVENPAGVKSVVSLISVVPFTVAVAPITKTLNVTGVGQTQKLTATVDGGIAPYTYQWYSNVTGSDVAIGGATLSTYTVIANSTGIITAPGIYRFYVIASDSFYPLSQPTLIDTSNNAIITAVP